MSYKANRSASYSAVEDFRLSPAQIHKSLLKHCVKRRYTRKTTLLTAGSPNNSIYFIEQGYAYLCHYEDKKLRVPHIAGKGCWITDKKSFYQALKSPEVISSVNLVVVPGSILQKLSRNDYYGLLHRLPYLELEICRKRIENFEKFYDTVNLLRNADAFKKVQWLLKTYPDILQAIPHKILAVYLGITTETFSRQLKEVLFTLR